MNNFGNEMNQYLGPPAGDSYFPYNSGFSFDTSVYPNLSMDPLPPAPTSDLFMDRSQAYPQPAHHSLSSGQGQMYPPPSLSEYPSNGPYWTHSPSPAPLQMPNSVPQMTAPVVPQGPPEDDDQRVQQEFLSLLDEYHPIQDNFYYPHHEGGHIMDNMSLPSPYGTNDNGDYSPPNSLMKPPRLDDCFPDYQQADSDTANSISGTEVMPVAENEDLSEINIRDLNKALREQGLSTEEQMEVKQMRRKQKNRVYAKNCRKNKEEKKTTMKTQKEMLETEINDLKSDVDRLRAQRNKYKLSYDLMQQQKQQNS